MCPPPRVCRQHSAQYFYMAPKFPYSLPFDEQVEDRYSLYNVGYFVSLVFMLVFVVPYVGAYVFFAFNFMAIVLMVDFVIVVSSLVECYSCCLRSSGLTSWFSSCL